MPFYDFRASLLDANKCPTRQRTCTLSCAQQRYAKQVSKVQDITHILQRFIKYLDFGSTIKFRILVPCIRGPYNTTYSNEINKREWHHLTGKETRFQTTSSLVFLFRSSLSSICSCCLARHLRCDGKVLCDKCFERSSTSLWNAVKRKLGSHCCFWCTTAPKRNWFAWVAKDKATPLPFGFGVQNVISLAIFPSKYTGVFGPVRKDTEQEAFPKR